MWAASQVFKRGIRTDRKEGVSLLGECAAACRCIVLALVEVGMWPVRKCKGDQRGFWF